MIEDNARYAVDIDDLIERIRSGGDLYVASNRGPNEYRFVAGHWQVTPGRGGLVAMLEPVYRRPGVTWLACAMTGDEREFARQSATGEIPAGRADDVADMRYVVAPAEEFSDYYGVIANQVLWPLQHGMWSPGAENQLTRRHYDALESYRRVNQRFADLLGESDARELTVLVQDYHLYLVPGYLRTRRPDARILHFTHIPWPSLREWQALPRDFVLEVFESLCAADVIGFQTRGDAVHFLASVEMLFGADAVDHAASTTNVGGRTSLVRHYPAAPDYAAVEESGRRPELQARLATIAPRLGERTILRVDRLDPAKNQILGFEAYRALLREFPERRRDTLFLAHLIPSRTDLPVYRAYRDAVFRLVGEINAEFSEPGLSDAISILYLNDQDVALAAMQRCDVLLANSVADGMNLVVKEALIISQKGVVPVVGQNMGVCEDMGDWMIPVAASDVWGTALALQRALLMPASIRLTRQAEARDYLRRNDVKAWLVAQLLDLASVVRAGRVRESIA